MQIGFRANHPIKRFIHPDRAASFHRLVHFVSRKGFDAVQNFRERMHTFPSSFPNRRRLNQQVNMVRHYARGVTFHFFPVPEMAGFQSFCTCFGRQNQLVVRLPGDVISETGNFKVRQIAFADGRFENRGQLGLRTRAGATPGSTRGTPASLIHRCLIFSSAAACAGFNTIGCVGKMFSRAYGSRSEISE